MSYDTMLDMRHPLRDFDFFDAETHARFNHRDVAIFRGDTRMEDHFSTLTPDGSYENRVTLSVFESLGLERDRLYIVRLRPRYLWWSHKTEEEIRGSTGRRDEFSLPYVPPIQLVCSDEVRFRVE